MPFSPALPSGICLQICLQSLREPRFLWLSLPTPATKGLPLPREHVSFKSSLTSFLCSWLSTRIFHDAILYGVPGKELLKVSSCAWSKPIVLPAQSPSMPLTPAWPQSCSPGTTDKRDVLIHTEGCSHKHKAQHKEQCVIRCRHSPPRPSHQPVAPGSAVVGDQTVTHQLHLTFPGEVHGLLLQPRSVILEWKVRSCSFYPFGGAICKENNAGFSGIRSISCIIF